eukprot:6567588-Prymnesium_polylepis.1
MTNSVDWSTRFDRSEPSHSCRSIASATSLAMYSRPWMPNVSSTRDLDQEPPDDVTRSTRVSLLAARLEDPTSFCTSLHPSRSSSGRRRGWAVCRQGGWSRGSGARRRAAGLPAPPGRATASRTAASCSAAS